MTSLDSERAGTPDHPIFPEAWTYEIVGLRLELAPADGSEPFLALTLERDGRRRMLRFFGPREVEIEQGGPVSGGLEILDVSDRGLDRLGVRVDDFEARPGALRFWARAVAEQSVGPSAA